MREAIQCDATEGHVSHHRAVWIKRRVCDSSKSRARIVVRWVLGPSGHIDEWRDGFVHRAFEAGEDGAHGRAVELGCLCLRIAGHTEIGCVFIPCANQRANHGALVHDGGKFREVFADFKPGQIGLDGLELATDIGWRIHFEVEGILMPDAAWEINHDDGFVAIANTSLCFGG